MTNWRPDPSLITRPAYRSLTSAIIHAVETGELKDGERLPTHRQLAYDLDLSVQTVSRAYEELTRRGVITGTVGRGTFVSASNVEKHTPYLPDRQSGAIVDCSLLKPVFGQMHIDLMRKTLGELSEGLPSDVVSSFRPIPAMSKYIHAAREWLSYCGLPQQHHPPLICNGATPAMTIAIMTAADPGELILAEELTHHTLKPLVDYLGLRVRGVKTDRNGMLPDALRTMCQRQKVRAIYLMPTGLNPRAMTMSLARREELIAVAREFNLLIIENDSSGPLQIDRPPPFAALAPDLTLYFTSLSKCIMPGLRVGFLVAPDAIAPKAANRHLVSNWMATPLVVEIAARWIEEGVAHDLMLWQRGELDTRNQIARTALSDISFNSSRNGMHLWLPLPESWGETDFVTHARSLGVAVAPGRSFALDEGAVERGVRVCIGAPAEQDLNNCLTKLSRLVRAPSEQALHDI